MHIHTDQGIHLHQLGTQLTYMQHTLHTAMSSPFRTYIYAYLESFKRKSPHTPTTFIDIGHSNPNQSIQIWGEVGTRYGRMSVLYTHTKHVITICYPLQWMVQGQHTIKLHIRNICQDSCTSKLEFSLKPNSKGFLRSCTHCCKTPLQGIHFMSPKYVWIWEVLQDSWVLQHCQQWTVYSCRWCHIAQHLHAMMKVL
jgi:hypothetical protein